MPKWVTKTWAATILRIDCRRGLPDRSARLLTFSLIYIGRRIFFYAARGPGNCEAFIHDVYRKRPNIYILGNLCRLFGCLSLSQLAINSVAVLSFLCRRGPGWWPKTEKKPERCQTSTHYSEWDRRRGKVKRLDKGTQKVAYKTFPFRTPLPHPTTTTTTTITTTIVRIPCGGSGEHPPAGFLQQKLFVCTGIFIKQ